MELFTITLTGVSEDDAERLYRLMILALGRLHNQEEGVELCLKSADAGPLIVCTAILPGFQLLTGGSAVYHCVGGTLAEYIVSKHENELLNDILTREYAYEDSEEIIQILAYCEQIINGEPNELPDRTESRRKTKIAEQIQLYLEENTKLHLAGFIRFRLQLYLDELRDVIDYAIDERLMDKQYEEFISLLKYFVYIQDAKIPVAHLMHKSANDFILLNEQLQPIETNHLDTVVLEMVDKEINYEDMIVSALITVSPRKVYIHTREPELQVIKTIQQIFEDRANVCTCCASCKPTLGERVVQGKIFT